MGLAIIAGAITVAFLNIDKIQSFKGGGFEAQMKKAVEDAYATIDNLKEMAAPLIVHALDTITYSGYIRGIEINKKQSMENDIEVSIKKLDINDEKVKNSIENFYKQITWTLFNAFRNEFFKGEGGQSVESKELESIRTNNWGSTNYPSKEIILKTLNISESDLDAPTMEKFQDYLCYMEKRELRRYIPERY